MSNMILFPLIIIGIFPALMLLSCALTGVGLLFGVIKPRGETNE